IGPEKPHDRRHDAEPLAGVLKDAALLDVHLDPAGEAVEVMDALAPALGLVAGVPRVLEERAAVVEVTAPLAQMRLLDALRHHAAAQQRLAEPGALLFEERDQLQRQAEV